VHKRRELLQLLILVLNQEEYLDDVLSAFVELGITGATIIDSVGMGEVLVHDVPIFAGLRHLLGGERPYSKTIFAVIEDGKFAEVAAIIEEICGPFESPGGSILLTLPIIEIRGGKHGQEIP
jgi:hypothetical protein